MPAGSGSEAGGLFERGFGIDGGGAAQRGKPEQNAAQHGNGEIEGQDCAADVGLFMCGTPAGRDGAQKLHASECHREARHPARRSQQHAFGEQLTQHAAAARAQGDAHRDLFLPCDGAGQQQIGNVHAHDQQNQPDRSREYQQGRPDIPTSRSCRPTTRVCALTRRGGTSAGRGLPGAG